MSAAFRRRLASPTTPRCSPAIAAVGLALAAVGLISPESGSSRLTAGPPTTWPRRQPRRNSARVTGGGDDMEVLETAKVPSRLLAILFTAGSVVFYLVAANFLGFVVTGSILLGSH